MEAISSYGFINNIMKFEDLVSLVLEANLYNKDKLLIYINSLLERKNVQKQQIKDWFLKQYVGWYISSKDDAAKYEVGEISPHNWIEGQPEWAKKSDIMYFNGWTDNTRDYLGHVIDYFNQLDENELNKIYKKPYEVVQRELAEWDKFLGSKRYKGPPLKEGEDVKTVMTFNDGYRWEKLITQQAYTAEGEMMGHCVGGYCENKNSVIYSLKDPKGVSHATIEFDLSTKSITQIKGRSNEAPVEKYWPYIKEFIIKNNFKVSSDGENIGMIELIHPLTKHFTYYFKDSPQFIEAKKENKKIIDGYIQSVFEAAKDHNGTVANVDMSGFGLDVLPDFSKITVLGYFNISHNNLTSLKGSPKKVNRLICSGNNLTSLEGGPYIVEETISAFNNKITSLKGAPMFINRSLIETDYFRMTLDLDSNLIEDINMEEILKIYRGIDSNFILDIHLGDNPISEDTNKFDDIAGQIKYITKDRIRLYKEPKI